MTLKLRTMKTDVLIIDDEREIGFLLNTVFQSLGVESKHALNLKEGLEMFEKHEQSHVFLDLNLPDGFGLNIVKQLKETRNDVSIIVITAQGSAEVKREAEALGVDKFIVKPFNREQIVNALNGQTSNKQPEMGGGNPMKGENNNNGHIQPRA